MKPSFYYIFNRIARYFLSWCYNFTMEITLYTLPISYSTGSVAVNRLQDLNIESSLVVYTVGVDCIWQKMYSQQYPDVLFS